MTLLWRDTMAVGNSLIDTDHRCMIGLVNTVELALLRNPELVRGAVEQLHHYAEEHFAREERIQRAVEFSGYAAHHASHEELLARLSDIRGHMVEAMDDSDGATLARLTQLLRQWLLDHIVKEDARLRPLLSERPRTFAG